ncbi:MAG: 5-bromo-4-chloroindolyl phosphate hydrolysis family protein [Lachnospiraceae bacterium]|nr:5-bromo-4-chloroindolyl phosphate hydrolysis family protein [Lachnospiraceae bacterium]
MGNINDLLNVGSGILNDVTRAIETGNYDGLGERTKERVTYAATQFAQTVQTQTRQTGQGVPPVHPQGGPQSAHPQMRNQTAAMQRPGYAPYAYTQPQNNSFFLARRQKPATGLGQIIGGTVGALIGGFGSLTCFGTAVAASRMNDVLAAGFGVASAGGGIFFAALFFISLGIMRSGIKTKNLIRRYYEYGAAIGNAEYFNIANLAARVGRSTKELTRDLEQMIRRNLLPGARMDRKKTTLMLTDRAYEQYQAAEASRVEREAKQQMRGEPAVSAGEQMDGDVKRIIDDGNRAILQVRAINDVIPDTQVMSNKLYRLEEIMKRIFEQVRKDPSSAPDLRRFMDYYLPTTTKLLSAYVELDRQPVQGDNIRKTKEEIETSLDTINDAFEQLLDGMFSDMAMDISTDISVMKTMMAQDGLANDNSLFDAIPNTEDTATPELKFQ